MINLLMFRISLCKEIGIYMLISSIDISSMVFLGVLICCSEVFSSWIYCTFLQFFLSASDSFSYSFNCWLTLLRTLSFVSDGAGSCLCIYPQNCFAKSVVDFYMPLSPWFFVVPLICFRLLLCLSFFNRKILITCLIFCYLCLKVPVLVLFLLYLWSILWISFVNSEPICNALIPAVSSYAISSLRNSNLTWMGHDECSWRASIHTGQPCLPSSLFLQSEPIHVLFILLSTGPKKNLSDLMADEDNENSNYGSATDSISILMKLNFSAPYSSKLSHLMITISSHFKPYAYWQEFCKLKTNICPLPCYFCNFGLFMLICFRWAICFCCSTTHAYVLVLFYLYCRYLYCCCWWAASPLCITLGNCDSLCAVPFLEPILIFGCKPKGVSPCWRTLKVSFVWVG